MIQKIKNNKILLPILLNYFVLGAFLYYIIFLWKSYPFSIGGSIVFISVIGIINYFSIAYKDYAMELSLFSLVLFLLMALNHLAFFEYKHGYSVSIEIMIGALTLTVATLACVLTIKPIKLRETSNLPSEVVELKKRIYYIVIHSFMVTSIYTIGTIAALAGMRENRSIGRECILYFSNLSSLWLVAGLVLVLFLMKKWDFLDAYISSLVLKKSQINVSWMRKWFGPLVVCIFLLGLGFEIQRGFWFLWFFTWLVFVLLIIMIWKVWRFVFEQEPLHIISAIESEKVNKLPSLTQPMYVFKFMIISAPVAVLYIILLILIEWKYCK